MWIVLFVPIYGLMFALAFIANGNGLGFAISIIVTIVASLVIYRMLRKK
jgi:preprotein translocase subunit SecD